jgi:hypothetical protein
LWGDCGKTGKAAGAIIGKRGGLYLDFSANAGELLILEL